MRIPESPRGGDGAAATRVVEILQAGWGSSIQDLGRPGWRHLGVTGSGAMDPESLMRANRRVGNPPDAAGLETSGGLTLVADGPLAFAVSGAVTSVSVDGHQVGSDTVAIAQAGQEIGIGVPDSGWRCYLACRGGLVPPPVLGSRSWDTLAHLGPGPVTVGTRWPVGPDPRTPMITAPSHSGVHLAPITVWPGPWPERHGVEVFDALLASTWSVSATSDRIGIRLEGPRLAVPSDAATRSEPLVPGAIQVTGDGSPIVMMRDHPTTGGYPVVGVVDPKDLGHLAHHRPGDLVTLRPIR